jgi:hypothetical protein
MYIRTATKSFGEKIIEYSMIFSCILVMIVLLAGVIFLCNKIYISITESRADRERSEEIRHRHFIEQLKIKEGRL